METFEVPLKTYLKINNQVVNHQHRVIIRESWGRTHYINNWEICDGYYLDGDNERVDLRNSDVRGVDFMGKEHQGSILTSSILLPVEFLKEI